MQKKTVKINVRRAAAVVSLAAVIVFVFIYELIVASGIVVGASSEVDASTKQLQDDAARRVTVEGSFLDCRGEPVTKATTAGEPGVLLYDECYSHLIGYSSSIYGVSGLRERLYDELYYGGADGVGAQVSLTVDSGLQQFCYELLSGTEGSIIVMNAQTGALAAVASRSSADVGYNANEIDGRFAEYSAEPAFFLNRAVMAQDPPGSVFKIITSAAMLANDMADFTWDDSGVFNVSGTEIRNFADAVYGDDLDLRFALNHSVNTYFAAAGVELGAGRLQVQAEKFMYGSEIELDFAALESNIDLGRMNDSFLTASTAFGQGRLAVSPLHIAMTMQAVMNGGTMVKPYVVEQITDDGKLSFEAETEKLIRSMGSLDAAKLKRLLHTNAEYYGFDEDTYGKVYAKTGTADQSNGLNHIYYLLGVEDMPGGSYVVLIDRANTAESSGVLCEIAVSVLNYLRTM